MEYKYEHEILTYLKTKKKDSLLKIAVTLKIDQNALMRPLISLEEKGLIKREVSTFQSIVLTEEGKNYMKNGLPEIRVYKKISEGKEIDSFTQDEKQFGIKWAKDKGFIKIINNKFVVKRKFSEQEINNYSKLYLSLNLHRPKPVASDNVILSGSHPSSEKGALSLELTPGLPHTHEDSQSANSKELIKRGLAVEKSEKEIVFIITNAGLNAKLEEEGITQLTSEMLRTGAWKGKKFKEFDVSIPAKNTLLGKTHPITQMIERIRLIFAELGFEEIDGNYIESAFWNFDSLFQPQDHPARELADTFYLEGEEPLPDKKLVEKVKNTHETGWDYVWSKTESKKRVLRTHTTALSARYLASMKSEPKKYFTIGRVFRNEATDYKHLAEFHQLEGIIAWKHATFRDLLGILKEFYAKLGFKKIRFRPSYFPYTEPSLEIIVYFEKKKEWVEIGAAGIMRPEVSIPLANSYPILAWGLSLERPLMMLMDINDIRTFYKNDLMWLRYTKVNL